MLTTTLRALIAFACITAAARAQPIELKVSHYLPPNHTVQKVLEDWAAELKTKSNGRLIVRVYPAGQLGPVQRQFDLARNGQADAAVGLTGATPGRYPMTEIAGLPFVGPAEGTSSAITSRRLTELAPKYLAPEFKGLHILWVCVTSGNSIFTSRKEIDGISDLQGLKIRFQGEQHAKVLRALGAVPLQVPPGEIADGMGKGVIDGAIFTYEAAESFGIGSVAHHYFEPLFLGTTLVFGMNEEKYNQLPPDLRAIIDETTGPDSAQRLGERLDEANAHGKAAMLESKVSINILAPAELEKLKATLQPLVKTDVDELDKAGKPASQLLADYTR